MKETVAKLLVNNSKPQEGEEKRSRQKESSNKHILRVLDE
jgi:hypothetical protein